MRSSFLLLAAIAPLALAAPLASVSESNAVARSEQGLALRDIVVPEERQLAPGGLNNIDLQGLINQVTTTLQGTLGLTGAQVNTLVSIVQGILNGKPLGVDTIPKLLTIPSSVLAKLPALLGPILLPATAGTPAVYGVVQLLFGLLKTLGGVLSGLGGLLGGRALSLPGVDVNSILAEIGAALKGTGLGDDGLNAVLDLVKGLLSGKPLDAALIGKLTALPENLLYTVLGVLNGVVTRLPVVGPVLSPLISTLQLLLLLGPGVVGGLVGGLTGGLKGAVTSTVGPKTGGILGLL